MQDIENKIKKFPSVSHVFVKYHKNIKNIITKHASLKIITAILAKKFVLYCRCSFNAYFINHRYFFIFKVFIYKTLRLHLLMVHFPLLHLPHPYSQTRISKF